MLSFCCYYTSRGALAGTRNSFLFNDVNSLTHPLRDERDAARGAMGRRIDSSWKTQRIVIGSDDGKQ